MIKWIFLAAFLLCSLVHLWHSFLDDKKKRRLTKPLLLIFLLLFYVTSAKPVRVSLLMALAFSWLGDVLLIPDGDWWFIIGGVSFLLGHILFIQVYAANIVFSAVPWLAVIPAALVYFGISGFVISKIVRTTPKAMIVPMFLYLLCNSTMNLFSFIQLLQLKNMGAAVAFAGALLFFASDCALYFVRYYRRPEIIFRKHFSVMLTYLTGELLIVLGMLLIAAG